MLCSSILQIGYFTGEVKSIKQLVVLDKNVRH